MSARKKRPDPESVLRLFVRTKEMREASGLSDDYLKTLRTTVLTEKIYWFRPPGSVRVLWHRRLVLDFLVNGNSPAHIKATENFRKSLASSQFT